MIPIEELTFEEMVHELHGLRCRVGEIEGTMRDGGRAEVESQRLTEGLEAVGRLAIDLGTAPHDANLRQIIGDSLREITGALFVIVSSYDVQARELVAEYMAGDADVVERLAGIMGSDVVGMRIPLTDEYYQQMLNQRTRTQMDAAESSMGVVSREVSDTVSEALGIGHFAALALHHGRHLMGTAVLAMGNGHESPLPQVMRLFAHVAAVSLQQQEAQNALRTKMYELRLAQAQLVHAANMAAVGELAASIAHELNNPLTSILGSADYLLERSGQDRREVRRLEAISRQARRARDVVRGLLDYARCEKGLQEPSELNPIVRSSIDLLRRSLLQRAIAIEEEYDQDLPLLSLDASKIRQVFVNLCTNAMQAMPNGGTLRVWTEQNCGKVAVRFADTGEGIPTQHLDRVFEPFFTTRANGEGSGLGLAISQGVVEEHGGRIEVESSVGVGSTFTVWLPLTVADQPPG